MRRLFIQLRDVRAKEFRSQRLIEHVPIPGQLVDGVAQRPVEAGDILVPDAITDRMQRGGLTRHQWQGQPQILGALLDGFLILHHRKISLQEFCTPKRTIYMTIVC